MGLFAYIKNGIKYKQNQFPGAYPANRVSYNGSDVETTLDEINADLDDIGDYVDSELTEVLGNAHVIKIGKIRLVYGRTNGTATSTGTVICKLPSGASMLANAMGVGYDTSASYIAGYCQLNYNAVTRAVAIASQSVAMSYVAYNFAYVIN